MKRKSFLIVVFICVASMLASLFAACNLIGSGTGGSDEDGKDKVVAVQSVTLNKTAIEMEEDGTGELIATVKPENATNKNIAWTTSDSSVATVSSGVVTAVKTGTATITVTTADGNKTASCTVTVKAKQETPPPHVVHTYVYEDLNETSHKKTCSGCSEIDITEAHDYDNDGDTTCKLCGHVRTVEPKPVKYTVTFMSNGTKVETQSVEKGKYAVSPTGVKNEGYTFKYWAVGSASGAKFEVAETPVESDLTLYAVWSKDETEQQPSDKDFVTYEYAGNESAAFEWTESNAAKASVEYKKSSASGYEKADAQLIRDIGGGKARVDIVGLAGGVKYDFKITASDGKYYAKTGVAISAYDRSGYAHFGKTDGVGAYNDDGTLKSGAVVVYVSEATKNTVKATINGKSYTGIVSILQNAGTKTPLAVRIIGTVGAATWKKDNVTYTKTSSNVDSDGNLKPEVIVGANGKDLGKKGWDQADLVAGGYNVLDTSVYSQLNGLSSKIKWDSGKNEYDSCWNDCSVSGVKNVTVEGIGEDARIFQWGITFRSCSSIEVRNLTFEDYTEDACSFEGGKSEDGSSINGFKTKNFWVHHNTFEEGVNYWDVCKEQDKHDGDGSTDFKYLSNVTISYNVYNKTHKTGLIGGGDEHHTANVTFHHNYYNGCKSRLPLARQANMHMYNNYYHATTGTDISLRANAYAFIENCYFDGAKSRQIEVVKGKVGTGAAKVVNCVINKKQIIYKDDINKKETVYTDSSPLTNVYLGNDRSATVTNTNSYSKTFDTDSTVFYYKNGKSDVTEMLTAEQVKAEIPKVAGVLKRGSGKIEGGSTGGSTGGETGGDSGNTGETPTTPTTPSTDKVTYTYSVANKEVVASANAAGTIKVEGWKTDTELTGEQISHDESDFRFDCNAYTITITVSAKAGQKLAVKLTGFTGSTNKAVGANVVATNATMTSANKEIEFSATSTVKKTENGTVEFTVNSDGEVQITIKRSKGNTTKITRIEVTVG